MVVSVEKRHLLIFAALTAASVLIFQISVVFFLFTVPLYVVERKFGFQYFSMALFFVVIVIVLQTLIRGAGIEGESLKQFLIVLELVYPLSLAVGVFVINYYRRSFRVVYLLLGSSLGFYLLSMVLVFHYSGNSEISGLLRDQIIYVADLFSKSAASADSIESAALLRELQPDRIVETTFRLIFRNYLFAYFIMLTGSWYLGDLFSRKSDGKQFLKFSDFRVPEVLLWLLLVSLVGILADILIDLSWIGFLMWNTAFIMLLLYGIHGIGLIGYLLNKYKVSRSGRRFIVIITITVLLLPGINLIILLGVPLFGVSELWVRYRA